MCDALAVSPATARRDLNQLAEQQLVVRTHGGASVVGSGFELPLRYKVPKQSEAKAAIAALTEQLIEPGMAVAVNGGTTTSEIARALGRSQRLASSGDPTVTLLTNALNIAYELTLRTQFRLILTGGVVRPSLTNWSDHSPARRWRSSASTWRCSVLTGSPQKTAPPPSPRRKRWLGVGSPSRPGRW